MKIFREQPDHEQWRNPFSPTEKAGAWAGLGLCFLMLGTMEWLTPPTPPFSGKWSGLYGPLYEAFSPRGIPAAILAAGGWFFIAALLTWLRARRKNTHDN